MKRLMTLCALLVALGAAAHAPARAGELLVIDRHGSTQVQTWQPAWDRFEYDRGHLMLGTVVKFQPFRLQLARRDGIVQTIDLKNGTMIFPSGATPMLNERVAVTGYYSRGTFIANRIIIHS